jgi:hypothetical protein
VTADNFVRVAVFDDNQLPVAAGLRFVHNDRLTDAVMSQTQFALQASPGARGYYDKQTDRGLDHQPALRQLTNRLVGILHSCLKTRTLYDGATAAIDRYRGLPLPLGQ